MDRKLYLVVTAGGTGTRMGAAVPKQFLTLGGKPILRRTMEAFEKACPSLKVVTVLPSASVADWKDYCFKSNYNLPQVIVEGGLTRFHSVQAALSRVPDGVIVAVHDGVRPLVPPELISRMISEMEDKEALIPVIPSVDTLRVLSKGDGGELAASGRVIDRSEIFAVQTPQMFRSELLKAAYSQPYDTAFTDDSSVAERFGIKLSFTEGVRTNIKITTPEDLVLAERLL
ncbi:MAG: 2-C-methyl-D-erythritol 4-phosphate cytidylyltransferase [Bacteroidales bacterium]|nr:2-C-methyl-D-erythritol 4-phosphate cytidylyltransferase [Bacteroidales bacterium]